MLEPATLAYISSVLGKGTKVKTPLTLECALFIGDNKLFKAQ